MVDQVSTAPSTDPIQKQLNGGFAQKVILDPLLRLCRPDVRRGFATPLVLSY
jgi:hypothetical protein